jgi:hypothetical protein
LRCLVQRTYYTQIRSNKSNAINQSKLDNTTPKPLESIKYKYRQSIHKSCIYAKPINGWEADKNCVEFSNGSLAIQ